MVNSPTLSRAGYPKQKETLVHATSRKLEFAASVTSLTGLALEIAKILHKYSSDVCSFPQDIESLVSEVDALSKVLKQLESFLREDEKGRRYDRTTSVFGSTVIACKNSLIDLKRHLEAILGRKFAKLMWSFVRLYNSYYDNQNKIVQSESLFGVASKLTPF